MQLYTKPQLIKKFEELADMGWVKNGRFGNHGGIGNTLEDYLGITENNLPIPNAAEWELKSQRASTSSLITLFHTEPSPRAVGFVPNVFLPLYGWPHKEAAGKYPATEMSFRQTINCRAHSDRGFIVKVDREAEKVLISFDASKVSKDHEEWLESVKRKVGLGELDPQPYWGFADLEHSAGSKLPNCFYVQADVKTESGEEYYWFKKVQMLRKFHFSGLLDGLERGEVYVDFDARTGHNHGSKFRLRQGFFPSLYDDVKTVVDAR